ncbi:MAG: Phage integrase family [Roseibaca calidilacus]|uniref:Phage integrase family n=1 Tax=Roseibaca calidilacus TaxID=1666912 RepID=A0A0P7YMX7_9RHOB|nr:MAG: Phage integrase family [Roseibaca calidilacus]CUX81082.1 Phage integrase family protein [Roseibaca calidilacus]
MGKFRVKVKGVHRVRKRLADGRTMEYHYAWRGGPKFWDSSMPFGKHTLDYAGALKDRLMERRDPGDSFQALINSFFDSTDFRRLAPRTQRDHKINVSRPGGIEEKYGKVPLKVFDDVRIRQNVLKWRDTFSDGTGDNIFATLQRILSFGLDRGILQHHHLLKVRKKVKKNRAEIVWTPDELETFIAGAPAYVGRILRVAVETGLRPGDIQVLKRSHIETTGNGNRRLLMRTRKSRGRNFASVPVTERLAELIKEIPEDQEHLVLNSDGEPFKTSEALGSAVSQWRDELGLRKELRLYDARGTAATRLVRAGCNLSELATHMGWSLAHAAAMLERYAALDPDMSDGILEKVKREEERRKK